MVHGEIREEGGGAQFTGKLEALAGKDYGFIQKALREEAEGSAEDCCLETMECSVVSFLPDRPALLCQARPLPISCTTLLSFCGQGR